MEPLLGLLAASFVAATLVPLSSEAALLAYLTFYPENVALALGVATFGNTMGGMTSYLIGRVVPRAKMNERALAYLRRYGAPATFFAWLPIVGDALCVAAGWLRVHWVAALAFMAAGRLTRYLAVAAILEPWLTG